MTAPARRGRRPWLAVAVAVAAAAVAAQQPAPAPPTSAAIARSTSAPTPGTIQIFDEATEKMVGEIKLKTGIPRSLTLSHDRDRSFYVLDSTLEKIEIVDIADADDARHLHAERGQQEGPHPRACRSIRSSAS